MRTPLQTAAILTVVAVVLHATVQYNLVSILPLPVFLSTLLVWMLPAPGYYLIALAGVGELLAGLPPGITTVIVLTPVAVFRLRSYIQADVSFSFFLLLMATYFLQLLLLALAHLWPTLSAMNFWQTIGSVVPWQLLGTMLLVNSVAAWLWCVIWLVVYPPKNQPASLFDRQRYAP